MEASVYGFRRHRDGLEGLSDWLSQYLDVPTATFVTDTLWFYYWYYLWPSATDELAVELNAIYENGANVRLTVPVEPGAKPPHGISEMEIPELQEAFETEVVRPLGGDARISIGFGSYQELMDRLIGRAIPQETRDGNAYHSAYAGDLLQDLRSLMPGEALEQWIDAPNTRFGGATPRELLLIPDKQPLRDLILEVRHGLPT